MLSAALMGAGCVFGREGDRDLSEFFDPVTPPEEETLQGEEVQAESPPVSTPLGEITRPSDEALLDLSVAPLTSIEAVQKFYAQIEAGQFDQAYRLVSLETRELISAEDFAQRYRDIWEEATITGLSWKIVPPQTEFVAGLEVEIRYQTDFFGEIQETVFAGTRRQPGWIVDWSPDLIFDGLGARDHLVHRFVEVPERGDILDRNGVVLATQGEIAIVGVVQDFIDEEDEEAVITAFTSRLNVDEQVVRDLVFQDIRSDFFLPVVRLPFDTQASLIADFERLVELGIVVNRDTRRVYPQSTLAAHVVGFMAEITEEELDELDSQGYVSGELVGRDGIEALFEEELGGTRGGRLTIIDPGGTIVREITAREPIEAQNVWLNLDVRVQQLAEVALGEEAGAVVALDPVDGSVVALASFPRFDPNAFIRGLTDEEFTLYFEDEQQPFINRTTEALYPPGSTFKIVTMAAAIEGAGFEASDQISCPAEWDGLGEDAIKANWKEEDRGLITITQAIAESCNTVFYEVAVALHNQDEDLLPSFAQGFGFGSVTGAVGVDEEEGVAPGPDWKRRNRNDFWFTGDTVNMSIGQGFLSATPLQIANAYAAVATDGILITPLVVDSIRDAAGVVTTQFTAAPTGVLPVSADTLADLRTATRAVISTRLGTGWPVFINSPLLVAGKSGSTDDSAEQVHALFVAYANINDPQLVVTVVLDEAESGADDAGPIARLVLERSVLAGWLN
jgi:penicillin-binding protein 2